MVIRKEQDGSIYIITTGGGENPTTDLKDHVEGILWWLGFHAFIAKRMGSAPAGGLRSYKLSEAPPTQKNSDWVAVIFYNEGHVTEFEKSTVKVKCVLKTQDYLRAVAILPTGVDRVLYTRREFLVFSKNGHI